MTAWQSTFTKALSVTVPLVPGPVLKVPVAVLVLLPSSSLHLNVCVYSKTPVSVKVWSGLPGNMVSSIARVSPNPPPGSAENVKFAVTGPRL